MNLRIKMGVTILLYFHIVYIPSRSYIADCESLLNKNKPAFPFFKFSVIIKSNKNIQLSIVIYDLLKILVVSNIL